MFQLHPRLTADCIPLGRFGLCRLLLMNESRYPWFILVPEREGIGEIHQLDEADQICLLRESSRLSAALVRLYRPDRLNLAAIGNLVPQLHVHHVVRYRSDPAWPAPVWGRFDPQPYPETEADSIRAHIARAGLEGFTAEA